MLVQQNDNETPVCFSTLKFDVVGSLIGQNKEEVSNYYDIELQMAKEEYEQTTK